MRKMLLTRSNKWWLRRQCLNILTSKISSSYIYIYASNVQLGVTISQKGKPIAFLTRQIYNYRQGALEHCGNPQRILYHSIWANYWGPYRPQEPHLARNSAQSTRAMTENTLLSQTQVYTRKTKCSHRCPIKVTNQN